MNPIKYLFLLTIALVLSIPETKAGGTVKDYQFYSKALSRDMNCRVYVPEAYDAGNPDKRFPVIYFLHGSTLGYDSYDAIYTILDNLIFFRLMKPVILVLPDGLAPPYNGSFYTNSALYGNFEDYISEDLVSFTDSAFHTRDERGQRAIMGASMGAYGALKMAFKHQNEYIGVAGHSGPVNTDMLDIFIPDIIREDGGTEPYHWSPGSGKSLTNLTFSMAGAFSPNLDDPYKVDFPLDSTAHLIPEVMARWKAENICDLVKNLEPVNLPGIYFDCGILDEFYLYYQNRALADTLTKLNIPYQYQEYIGTHTSGLPIQVSRSLVYLDNLFQTSDAALPGFVTTLKWDVFPNPASNTLYLTKKDDLPYTGQQMILIADESGRLVTTYDLPGPSAQIDISNLPPGNYFYKIQSGNRIQTGRTLIVR